MFGGFELEIGFGPAPGEFFHQPGIDQRGATGLFVIDDVIPVQAIVRNAMVVQVDHGLVDSMGDPAHDLIDILGVGEEVPQGLILDGGVTVA